MIWKQNNDISVDYVKKLSADLNINPLLLRLFLNRNNDENAARIALTDLNEAIIPAEKLVNAQEVADVITKHILNGSRICIHADYDSDGLNSGVIMYEAIYEIITQVETINRTKSTATVEVYFPERIHGYGLSMYYAENLIKNKKDEDILVITVDNGIAQVEQIELLIKNGIEVVVTDHHESKIEGVPNCLICNPHNKFVKQDNSFHHLCGAGVAFKVCELLQKNFGYHSMYKFLPYVAIATITDVMPLTLENMAFIRYGLDIINSDMCPTGIAALKDFLGIELVNSCNVAWEIGPRLNACGRMNNTAIGGDLLLSQNIHLATDLVNELELINEARKEATNRAVEQLDKFDCSSDEVCLIKLEDIPEGIVGIIAGRAAEKFNKPAIVVVDIGEGKCKGSSRSVDGIDLHYLFNIEVKKGNIINFGGHSDAAGILFDELKLEDLRNGLNTSIKELKSNNDVTNDNDKNNDVLLIDECISIEHINKQVFDLINILPYDKKEFTKPIFALTDCTVTDFIPTRNNPDNLWITLSQGTKTIKLWCRGLTDRYKAIGCPKKVHVAGSIEKNFMQGRPYILDVIDIIDAS